jgi:hypothetical protein
MWRTQVIHLYCSSLLFFVGSRIPLVLSDCTGLPAPLSQPRKEHGLIGLCSFCTGLPTYRPVGVTEEPCLTRLFFAGI